MHCRPAQERDGCGVEMQIELFEGHGKHVDALDTYRDLCVRAQALDPAPRGVSAGLTGRLAANHALAYLSRIPGDASAAPLICRSLEQWLLKVRTACMVHRPDFSLVTFPGDRLQQGRALTDWSRPSLVQHLLKSDSCIGLHTCGLAVCCLRGMF